MPLMDGRKYGEKSPVMVGISGDAINQEVKHSCTYVNLFKPNADRSELYDLVDDFVYGRDFKHFKKKYVESTTAEVAKIDYRRLFTPTQYNLKFLMKDYLDQTRVLKNLSGLSSPMTQEEQRRLNKFYKLNKWNSLFKEIIKERRMYGDVYLGISIRNIPGYGKIPILRKLDKKGMSVLEDRTDPHYNEYIYTEERSVPRRDSEDSLDITTEEEEITLLFRRGSIIPFVGGEPMKKDVFHMPTRVSDSIPLLHFKFGGMDCSEIPALDFVDSILRLHRIETDLAETNSKSGSPQEYVIDGIVDTKSKFGARCVAYIDTTQQAMTNGKQAKLQQMEITNALESLFKEQESVLDGLFHAANLTSPSLKSIMAKSDSSKAIKFLSRDLLEELEEAYDEISEVTKPLWLILFPDREEEDIKLEVPMDLENSSMLDKATYINSSIMTIRQVLKDRGKTEAEIESFMEDLNQQIQMLQGKGIDPVLADPYGKIINPDIGNKDKEIQEEIDEGKDSMDTLDGVDSNLSKK